MYNMLNLAVLALATTLALVQGQVVNPCPWKPERRDVVNQTSSIDYQVMSAQYIHLVNGNHHKNTTPTKEVEKRAGPPLQPCVSGRDVHCYCYPPRPLYVACEPITSGYVHGTIPNTCENYKAYVKCWNEVQPYCTPQSLFGEGND